MLSAACAGCLAAAAGQAEAAEGGASNYLPGTVGDNGLALPPQPGFLAANILWTQSGDVGAAVLQGRVNLNVDVDVVLDIVVGTYTFAEPILGAAYTVGVAVPFGHAGLGATLTAPGGGTFRVSESSFDLSDIVVTPIQLNWNAGTSSWRKRSSCRRAATTSTTSSI